MADPGHRQQRRHAFGRMRQDRALGGDRDDKKDGRGDERRFEGHPPRRSLSARGLDGEKIKAEEQARRDAEHVAESASRTQMEALREQRRPAGDAEAEPREDASRHSLAKKEPAEQHDPDRRCRGEKGGVGDAGLDDRQVPEEEVAGESQPRQDRGLGEPLGRRLPPLGEAHPGVEQRQRQRDTPEGARERSDVGEADENRRNAHRDRARDQSGEGRENAARRRGRIGRRHAVDSRPPAMDSGDQNCASRP